MFFRFDTLGCGRLGCNCVAVHRFWFVSLAVIGHLYVDFLRVICQLVCLGQAFRLSFPYIPLDVPVGHSFYEASHHSVLHVGFVLNSNVRAICEGLLVSFVILRYGLFSFLECFGRLELC